MLNTVHVKMLNTVNVKILLLLKVASKKFRLLNSSKSNTLWDDKSMFVNPYLHVPTEIPEEDILLHMGLIKLTREK